MSRPLLHDYFRSSASYRVRIALRLKGVEHDSVSVDLRTGDQRADAYKARNPQGFVPMLEMDGLKLSQSLAIIAYLDSVRPEPPLLPAGAADQAHVRAMALLIACDIHPLNNLRVLHYLKNELGQDEPVRNEWYRHWVAEGFEALEALAKPSAGRFLYGDLPTVADVCLVPQMYNARRLEVPLDDYPLLVRVDFEANKLDAFAAAHPDRVAG
ncbi:MAG: maiA [Alphaproteobacteria bacterium]|jgi:maleylacetoacetate isomerase|nr:maiA [Alphaproteobacteria bacterium]